MASKGVNVKMGVSGVAQFKQGMKQAQQSVKVLDAELALNEKQYKASGDAEAYMETKAELLRKKLEEQKTAIANAEKALQDMNNNGVDKASTAYQNMQIALARAKGDLADTETQMGNISQAAVDAQGDITDMNSALAGIDKKLSFQNVTDSIGTITGSIENAARKAWELGTALVKSTLGAGSWADELQTAADQYDIPAEKLYRMRKTALLIDTDAETILAAQDKMNKNFATSKDMGSILENLGLSNIVSTDTEDNFWAIGEALLNMGDDMTQVEYAQKIFGKSWRELLPVFKAGREEYEKTNASWDWIGDENLDNLKAMDDQYQKLTAAWETFQAEMLSAFAGPLTEGMETLTGLFHEFNEYLQTDEGQEMLTALGDAVSGLFTDLTTIDPQKTIQGFTGVFNTVVESLKWIIDHSGEVVGGLEAVVIGWGALKLTGGALEIIKLINGLSGFGKVGAVTGAATAGTAAGTSWGSAFGAAVGKAALAAAPWLAGLLVWGKNAITPQGNDDLWDENGNPTALAQSQGVTWNKDEDDQHGDYYDKLQNGKIVIDARTGKRVEVVDEVEDEDLTDTYTRQQMGDAIQDWWDARRNAENGTEPLEEELSAQDWMEQVLGENFGEVWSKIVERLDEVNQSKLEDIPTDWYSDILDAITGEDDDTPAQGLNGLPGKIAAAVAGSLNGVKVEIDGQTAGSILSPYISANMGDILAYLIKYG